MVYTFGLRTRITPTLIYSSTTKTMVPEHFCSGRCRTAKNNRPSPASTPVIPYLGKDFQWYGVERKIRIEVSGNEYRAYIDGELVVVGKDDSYTNGMVGLRTWVKGATTFENLVVTELKGE